MGGRTGLSAGLRAALATDFPQLQENLSTPTELMLWSGPHFKYPFRREAFERHLRLRFPDRPRRICLAFEREADGRFRGYIEFGRIEYEHRNATLARVLVDRRFRGQGVGRRMLQAALQMGFDGLAMHRIDLRVYRQNEIAIRLYESLGFRSEGVHRDTVCVAGQWWSAQTMSMLADEYGRTSR